MLGDLEFGILASVFIRVQFAVVAVSLEVEQTSKKQPPPKKTSETKMTADILK